MTSRDIRSRTAISIRPAAAHEAQVLTDMALRSKASWGYDDAFMERCRAVLEVTPEYIQTRIMLVAEEDALPVAFYSIRELSTAGEAELDLMFVEPRRIRSGIGGQLLRHALDTAAAAGFSTLWVESDPFAEAFYRRHGAEPTGLRASTVEEGRQLPLLRFQLSAPPA